MGCVPPVAVGFFPLDEELELLPGQLTPRGQEQLVRLGAWMPFAQAVELFEDFTRVTVTEAWVRRHTEQAGAAAVAHQTAAVEQLERETPAPPVGPDKLCLSADGAFVPLVHKEWAEVKTLMVGEVAPPVIENGEPVVHLQAVSYFSRLTDHQTFARLALVETQRRGVESAHQVAAVTDGAEWLQGFIQFHRADAVRILDFPHAASYVNTIGQGIYGEGTPESLIWLQAQLHALKHEGPSAVLSDLHALTRTRPDKPELEAAWEYLDKREAHLHYPRFQAEGWPIGSGAVESGNKLVVEARLKGSGMHWARPHVDPLLALRNLVCNQRWAEGWAQIVHWQRHWLHAQQVTRRLKRQAARLTAASVIEAPLAAPPPPPVSPPVRSEGPASSIPGSHRPAANHPWRHMCVGRAQYLPAKPKKDAKL